MPYAVLIQSADCGIEGAALAWETVEHHLDKLQALGKDSIGRRLTCFTSNEPAAPTVAPRRSSPHDGASAQDSSTRPHRHTSARHHY